MERTILHSDMNCFYASVEMMLDPSLKGKAVAVCGSEDDRHGICLAKSEIAKKAGIRTGMVTWQAKQLCPELIIVPPQYDQYVKYSQLIRTIYQRYTDRIEPYGLDECWLDITGCTGIASDGIKAAEHIRSEVREELGLTASIGISFNKIFAKLGSDMKKPDAQTVIDKKTFKDSVWPLDAGCLLYVGRATKSKLLKYNINTIGDIARTAPDFLKRLLGINGLTLWKYANGLDDSRVMHMDYRAPVKSIGHGITSVTDLINDSEVWLVILELSQDIGHKLKKYGFKASGIQIVVRDNNLLSYQFQAHLDYPTQSESALAKAAHNLFVSNYTWQSDVRMITVRAINLVSSETPAQTNIYCDFNKIERREKLEMAVDTIRNKYGKKSIQPAALLGDLKIPIDNRHMVTLPGLMYQ
jgi:DNA polymerase-4